MSYSQTSLARPHLVPVPVRELSLEYRGFRNVRDRREYLLFARLGTASCEYTVWIANSAFAAGQALFQDGPDICYQKLRRELVAELTDGLCIEVTASDLQEYRVAHLPPQRRNAFTPKPSAPVDKRA
jgi:hypothetical protein